MKVKKIEPNKWLLYTDLAWVSSVINDTKKEEITKETEMYCKLIKEYSEIEVKTLLHLCCGAGANDNIFKIHFKVTGVDISEDMLKIAKKINPEVVYLNGDIRTIKLKETFDAVIIPDNSISHMTTLKDIRKAIITAYKHLKPGGCFLIETYIAEEFNKQYNLFYTCSRGDIEVTVFGNSYMPDIAKSTCEKSVIILIRRKGKLKIYTDCCMMGGMFKRERWLDLFNERGFEVKHIMKHESPYDSFIVGGGKCPTQIFVCVKPQR